MRARVSARARVGVRARVCARACRPGGAHRGTVCLCAARVSARAHAGRGEPTAALSPVSASLSSSGCAANRASTLFSHQPGLSSRACARRCVRVSLRARVPVCARVCRPGGAHRGTVARQRQLEQLRVRRKPRGESRDELCERVRSVEQRTETIKLPALYHPSQRWPVGEGVQALELPRRHLRGRVRWTRPRRCAMR